MGYVKFDVKQFSSGEWQVKITERIYGDVVIHWNWFDKDQRDLMLLLTKIGAIKKQYGMIPITVYAPYLPYARQDRIFEAGQDLAIETLIKAICGKYDDVKIKTMALHCNDIKNVYNQKHHIDYDYSKYKIVFPNNNADQHFKSHYIKGGISYYANSFIYFKKERIGENIHLLMDKKFGLGKYTPFLICDDICAGGRTFIECAKALRKEYGDDREIELMIYHAFLDYGLDGLQKSGINKINIINPDSYEYICNLYPNDLTYFEYKDLNIKDLI